MNTPKLWADFFEQQKNENYFTEIETKIQTLYNQQEVYPPKELVFNCFNFFKPENTKVVILGQDPYHNPNQAHGLSFSVPETCAIPPSLKNIFKAIENNFNCTAQQHGDLTYWAKQGVLLLNSVLTVEPNKPGSHKNLGWQTFTDKVIEHVSTVNSGCVFLLWGSYAQKKSALIDAKKHKIIKTVHPSPLSAYRGFLTSTQFLETNEFLASISKEPINWCASNHE